MRLIFRTGGMLFACMRRKGNGVGVGLMLALSMASPALRGGGHEMKKIEQEKPRQVQGEDGTWLRTEGLLKILPVSRRTLDRWRARNLLPFVRVGPKVLLYRRSDVERMLSRMTIREI